MNKNPDHNWEDDFDSPSVDGADGSKESNHYAQFDPTGSYDRLRRREEEQWLRDEDYLWPGEGSKIRKRSQKGEDDDDFGYMASMMEHAFEHFDCHAGRFEFYPPQLCGTSIRHIDEPLWLRLPKGVGEGAYGINCGHRFIIEHGANFMRQTTREIAEQGINIEKDSMREARIEETEGPAQAQGPALAQGPAPAPAQSPAQAQNQSSTQGPTLALAQSSTGKITISLGKRRRSSMPEDEVSARFFQINELDHNHWTGAFFSPTFYKSLVFPNLNGVDFEAEDPVEWARNRANLVIAFIFEMGYSVEFTFGALERAFWVLAKEAANRHQPELDTPREFKNTEKAQTLLKALRFSNRKPIPETACFVLSLQDYIDEPTLRDRKVRKLLRKIPRWLDNGLVIDRAIELFRLVKMKTGKDGKATLMHTLEILDAIYGGDEPPWYFKENVNFKSVFYGTKILVMDPEEAMAIVGGLAKHAGPCFEHAVKIYFSDDLGERHAKLLGDREKVFELFSKITKWYGIGNHPRALNTLRLLYSQLEKSPEKYRKEFVEAFVGHAEVSRPGYVLLGVLEGEDCNVSLPGFTGLMKVFYGGTPTEKSFKFANITVEEEELTLLEQAVNAPFEERSAKTYDPGGRIGRYFKHPLIAGPARQFKLLASGANGQAKLPAETGTAETPSAPTQTPSAAESTATAETPEQKAILHRLCQLYAKAREEIGPWNIDEAINAYGTVFALRMPDPFNPPRGLLKLLAKVMNMPEMDRLNASISINPYTGKGREKKDDIIPRSVLRNGAILNIIQAWIEGTISLEELEDLLEFLSAETFEVVLEETFEEYRERKLEEQRKSYENEDQDEELRYRSTPEERAERLKYLEAELPWRYAQKSRNVKENECERRVNNLTRFMQIYMDFMDIIERLGFSNPGRRIFLRGLLENFRSSHPERVVKPKKKDQERIILSSRKDDFNSESGDGGFFEDEEDLDYSDFVREKVSDWLNPFGEKSVTMESLMEEFLKNEEVARALERVREELAAAESVEEQSRIVFRLFTEMKIIQSLRMIANEVMAEINEYIAEQEIEDIGDVDQFVDARLEKVNLTDIELKNLARLHRRIRMIEDALDERLDISVKEMDFSSFRYIPPRIAEAIASPIRRVKEILAIIGAISDIKKTVTEQTSKATPGTPATGATAETIREATRTSLQVAGTMVALMYHDNLAALTERRALPDNVVVMPGTNALVVTDRVRFSEGDAGSAQELRKDIVERVKTALPELQSWIERIRTEDIGLFPVGAKIHVLHSVNPETFERVRRLLGIDSSYFKLIHAEHSIIVPPMITAKELSVFIFSLQQLGLIDQDFPELQICGPGRLENENAIVVGSAILLSTELGKKYPRDAFVTTHDQTGTRMMAYDAGECETNLPYMVLPSGEKIGGRTDILGRRTLADIEPYRLLHTVVSHAQFDMVYGDIGRWFIAEYRRLLIRYGLADIFNAKWVLDPKSPEAYDLSNENQNRHYAAVEKCTDAYFACARGENDIVYAVRDLIEQVAAKVRDKQQEIRDNPDAYPEIHSDWQLAVNY